jgi:homogentisate 1,2-dioxygenase
MPIYHQLGVVPRKRNATFLKADGGDHFVEQVGSAGYGGASTRLYHLHDPARVVSTRQAFELVWKKEQPRPLRYRHFRTHRLPAPDRIPLLFNDDVALHTWTPHKSGFYRNAQADEVLFVTEGAGTLETQMGELPYQPGDFVVIPRGIIHRLRMDPVRHRFFIIESRGAVRVPRGHRNGVGQLRDDAPYGERDIRRPRTLPVHDERGEFSLVVKKDNWLQEVIIDHHPLDVAGWDGYFYPWALSANDCGPGKIFSGDGFAVGQGGLGEEAVYLVKTAASGLEGGSLLLHPEGLTPKRAAGSEMAVRLTVAKPLEIGEGTQPVEDLEYPRA